MPARIGAEMWRRSTMRRRLTPDGLVAEVRQMAHETASQSVEPADFFVASAGYGEG
jgi:hypothetical protein